MTLRLLAFAGSLRKGSLNRKLLRVAAGMAEAGGGIRGLWQLRIPLEGCGVFVLPDMFIVPNGRDAFTPEGGLANPEARARLEKLVQG